MPGYFELLLGFVSVWSAELLRLGYSAAPHHQIMFEVKTLPHMNSLFILAHAPLAHALRQCALHVFPDCADWVAALDVQPNVSPDETLAAARIVSAQVGNLPGVGGLLVLTDVFGATPCNVAQKLCDGISSKLVCGVNLPMLLRTLSYRHEPLDALVARAVSGGTQGVMQVNITAPQNQALRNFGKHDQDHYFHQQ